MSASRFRFVSQKVLFRSLVVAFCVVVTGCAGEPATVVGGDLAFVGVNVIPMTGEGEPIIEHQLLIVTDGRITFIGDSDEAVPAENVEVVNAEGQYLMPGMVEMHGHLPNPRMSDEDIRNLLFLYVANGVTTVRGMQGDPSQFALRSAIERGRLLGPRLYLASVAMSGESVTTAEQAVQLAREYKVDGYDLIKTHEGISQEVFEAMVATAGEVSIPFGGHVPDDIGLRGALASGQASIDHLDNYVEALVSTDHGLENDQRGRGIDTLLDEIDASSITDVVDLTVKAGTWVVPTMVLWETAFFGERSSVDVLPERPEVRYMPRETVDRWRQAVDGRLEAANVESNRRISEIRRRILKALFDGGANIALGTDSPQIFNVPGFAMYHEMLLYVEIGMTPYEVLEIATRRPAEYFDATDEFGVIAVGRRADFLLLNANPMEDIENMRARAGVSLNGRWMPNELIERRLGDIALFYGNEP